MSDTTTWWQVDLYKPEIRPVQVVKRTTHYITVREDWYGKTRERRLLIDKDHYETYEQARSYLLHRESARLQRARDDLAERERRFAVAQSLPESAPCA